jgi:putative component of toxin-antitoxin plasmid stabilization module
MLGSVARSVQTIGLRETEAFSEWLSGLQDPRTRAEVARRVRRLALGNPGDVMPVADCVGELRIPCGPKGSQAKDIAVALTLATKA